MSKFWKQKLEKNWKFIQDLACKFWWFGNFLLAYVLFEAEADTKLYFFNTDIFYKFQRYYIYNNSTCNDSILSTESFKGEKHKI